MSALANKRKWAAFVYGALIVRHYPYPLVLYTFVVCVESGLRGPARVRSVVGHLKAAPW